VSNNPICPFCRHRISACTCVVDFEVDEDLDNSPVIDDEYDQVLESKRINPEESAILFDPFTTRRAEQELKKSMSELSINEERLHDLYQKRLSVLKDLKKAKK
jgi:hypothetical protein